MGGYLPPAPTTPTSAAARQLPDSPAIISSHRPDVIFSFSQPKFGSTRENHTWPPRINDRHTLPLYGAQKPSSEPSSTAMVVSPSADHTTANTSRTGKRRRMVRRRRWCVVNTRLRRCIGDAEEKPHMTAIVRVRVCVYLFVCADAHLGVHRNFWMCERGYFETLPPPKYVFRHHPLSTKQTNTTHMCTHTRSLGLLFDEMQN